MTTPAPFQINANRLARRIGAAFDAYNDTRSNARTHDAIRAEAAWDATARLVCDGIVIGMTPHEVKTAVGQALTAFYAERPFSPTRGREAAETWMAERSAVILAALESLR